MMIDGIIPSFVNGISESLRHMPTTPFCGVFPMLSHEAGLYLKPPKSLDLTSQLNKLKLLDLRIGKTDTL
jgi:hypothetical protein